MLKIFNQPDKKDLSKFIDDPLNNKQISLKTPIRKSIFRNLKFDKLINKFSD